MVHFLSELLLYYWAAGRLLSASPGESAFAGCVISYSVFARKTSDFGRKIIFGDFASVPWLTDRCLYKMTKTFKVGGRGYMVMGRLKG